MEDAPSGLIAGRAAGARTLAVCTSHTRDKIVESGAAPDFIVDDLTRYEIEPCDHCYQAMLTQPSLGYPQGGSVAKLWSRLTTLWDKSSFCQNHAAG